MIYMYMIYMDMIYMDTDLTDINTTGMTGSDRYISVAKELETAESATSIWDCGEFPGTDVNIDTAITELCELENESECVDLADINTTAITGPNRYIAVFPDEEVANSDSRSARVGPPSAVTDSTCGRVGAAFGRDSSNTFSFLSLTNLKLGRSPSWNGTSLLVPRLNEL
jgi:hypothetical protein